MVFPLLSTLNESTIACSMSPESEIVIGKTEIEPSGVLYEPRKSLIITLSGVSGTGKTTAGQAVAEKLGIGYVKIGAGLRQEAETQTGSDIITFYNRPVQKDYDLDLQIIRCIRDAREKKKSYIIEGWLAGFHAYREFRFAHNEQRNSPLLYRYCFIAGDDTNDTRYLRVLDRQRKKNPDLMLGDIKQATDERLRGDLQNWWEAYPELQGINPLHVKESTRNKDIRAKIFYNQIVDTEDMSILQVEQFILEDLVEVGLIRKLA